jgi:hypothetical protein
MTKLPESTTQAGTTTPMLRMSVIVQLVMLVVKSVTASGA